MVFGTKQKHSVYLLNRRALVGVNLMPKSDINLPPEINARVRIQSADVNAFHYLCWRGFHTEVMELGGWYVMRRDFHDGTWSRYPEPQPPKFPIEIL